MNTLEKDFSDEEIARDWTLSDLDLKQISAFRKSYQLYAGVQICSVRLQGFFLASVQELSPHIINYLNSQIGLPLTMYIRTPTRRATRAHYHRQILTHLGFRKYDEKAHPELEDWARKKAEEGLFPHDILLLAEEFLLKKKIVLPSRITLERQINSWCSEVHSKIFESIYNQLSPQLKRNLNDLLVSEENQVSLFSRLKESPPSARISSLKIYLDRYKKLEEITLEQFDSSVFSGSFTDYLFRLAKYYNAAQLKRFRKQKRLSLLICFLLEVRKELLDNLVKMHDQYILDLSRRMRNLYEKKHRQSRKKNKRAVDTVLKAAKMLVHRQNGSPPATQAIIEAVGEEKLLASIADLNEFKYLEERGYREKTLTDANAEIVNHHHLLPISKIYGTGEMSSSDAQRFRLRADSLIASYYPRYYGFYDKAIGIYTHVSDQYSVFNTKVISCSPREALYVLDGLLENNTILKPKEHTTDTHGYTEIIFALCHLLGFHFMPRIRDLKKQQLYKITKDFNAGTFSPLLKKSVNLNLIAEQWDAMIRVAVSLKNKTAPAHIIVQRLMSSSPSDRLSQAFTHLGRIIKTQYIIRYISDAELRRSVRIQLNKGEYRHKLPRWIFFANQGIFNTSDFEEIMNKASCLSLVSNSILYWNSIKIEKIIDHLKRQGEEIDDAVLARISLLPYKHVLPQGTYFVENK